MLIAALHGQKSFEECCQYIRMCRKRRQFQMLLAGVRGREVSGAVRPMTLDFDNLADFGYIVVGWCAIWRQAYAPASLEKPFMSFFSGASWLRLLYSLRGETWIGPRLLPILSALKDTGGFVVVTVTCVCAATHAYYNLQLREDPTPTYAAFMQIFRLGILGDFDLFEFEGLDPTHKLNADSQEWEPQDPDPGPDYAACSTIRVIVLLIYFGCILPSSAKLCRVNMSS